MGAPFVLQGRIRPIAEKEDPCMLGQPLVILQECTEPEWITGWFGGMNRGRVRFPSPRFVIPYVVADGNCQVLSHQTRVVPFVVGNKMVINGCESGGAGS